MNIPTMARLAAALFYPPVRAVRERSEEEQLKRVRTN